MSRPSIEPAPSAPRFTSGVILFPGPLGQWEVWDSPGTDGARLRPNGLTQLSSGTSISAAGLPVESVLNFVFRAPPSDASTLRALATVQLEQRTFATENGLAPVFDVVAAGQVDAEKQRPVLVEELTGTLPTELARPEISRFETSARMLPLPPDGCALWLENNRLVIAVTRQKELLYFQALSDAQLTPSVLDELRNLGGILKLEGLMPDQPAIWIWADLGAQAGATLGTLLGGTVKVEPRPAPRLPSRAGNLVPSSVVQARQQIRVRARRRWMIGGAAAIYLAMMSVWVGVLLFREMASRRLQADLDHSHSEVESLQGAALAWKQMQPTIDPSNFPLVLLLKIRTAMPETNVWLTEFRIVDGVVDLRGATTEVDLVYKFRQKLAATPSESGIEWDFDTPTIQADNTTQFRVHGKLPYASAE